MSTDAVPAFIVTAARAHRLVAPGSFRVVALERDGKLTIRDFSNLEGAQRYAEDAASESDGPGGTPYAYVFDDKLVFLSRGSHYAAR